MDRTAVAAAVPSALAAAPATPATAATLRALLPEAAGPWPLVVAGLIIYCAVAALLLTFAPRPLVVAVYALLATAVALLTPHLTDLRPRFSIWAQSESQDHGGRYTALAETTGTGRVVRTQILPELLEGAEPCAVADDAPGALRSRWDWDSAGLRFISVTLEQRLFATYSVCWRGGFALTRPASSRRLAGDAILVTNRGSAVWPSGVVLQDAHRYALPSLAPGMTRVLSSSALAPESAATDLAAMSGDHDHAVLLWPLQLPARAVETLAARAFLAVRAANDPEGR